MKAHLLFADADLDVNADLPANAEDLIADLGLNVLVDAMAGGDKQARTIVAGALLHPLTDPDAVFYRQQVLTDCLRAPQMASGLYELARDTIEGERNIGGWFFMRSPDSVLHRSINVLDMLLGRLRALRTFADQHAGTVNSVGFSRMFAVIAAELDDDYLAEIEIRIRQLRMQSGMLISARLGTQNQSIDLALRDLPVQRRTLLRRPIVKKPAYSYTIPDRDEASTQALSELRNRVVDNVANAAAQSADHVLSFFTALRDEMAFYLAAMRLHAKLTALGVTVSLPQVLPIAPARHQMRGLVDPALALAADAAPVGNDLDAPEQQLVMITGANRGGKSTFLRAVGIGTLMAGAGLFVAADAFTSSAHPGVFCHFRREEDAQLRSGKLDEELRRMATIAQVIEPGALLLCNESFSATNEAEGSELARQVVTALADIDVTVVFVTHLYAFAHTVAAAGTPPAVFLRAERGVTGQRPYTLVPAEPLPTSYGADVFRRVFGTDPLTLDGDDRLTDGSVEQPAGG